MGAKVAVLDYGIGNLHSAQKGLLHLGVDAKLTSNPAEIEAADGVVLPGVGAFGATMNALEQSGLGVLAVDAAASGRPFLGICVGMQVLYERSEEAPDVKGLGILNGSVRRLPAGVKHPQMQWNKLEVTSEHPLLEGLDGEWFYFVHSFAAEHTSDVIAVTDYGGPVVAASANDNVWATQFHPEKSSNVGLRLVSNFVKQVERSVA